MCAACHGVDGNSQLPDYPKLAGQHSDYLAKALRDYKSGARKNPIMAGFAGALSKDDIANLAAWFSSQPRGGVVALLSGARGDRPRRSALPLEAGEVDRASGGVPWRCACHSTSPEAVEHGVQRGVLVAPWRASGARSARGCRAAGRCASCSATARCSDRCRNGLTSPLSGR